ncbi:MAG: 4Fe-4S dicluster domain-containing protein, partial [Acidobacteriota bacterium]
MKAFVVDLSICNGCYCCQIACKDEHVANDWTPYARPQPDHGQFWIKVDERVRGTVPKVKVSYFPQLCRHCSDAACIAVCKPNAIYRREDGLVIIDPLKCTGCKLCPDACSYDRIYFNDSLNIAQKCTGCAHLLDDGWDLPRCVDACPTDALRFGDESELRDLIRKEEAIKPVCGPGLVHYLNLPEKFVAGTVYDPIEKEVIIGAACILEDKVS